MKNVLSVILLMFLPLIAQASDSIADILERSGKWESVTQLKKSPITMPIIVGWFMDDYGELTQDNSRLGELKKDSIIIGDIEYPITDVYVALSTEHGMESLFLFTSNNRIITFQDIRTASDPEVSDMVDYLGCRFVFIIERIDGKKPAFKAYIR